MAIAGPEWYWCRNGTSTAGIPARLKCRVPHVSRVLCARSGLSPSGKTQGPSTAEDDSRSESLSSTRDDKSWVYATAFFFGVAFAAGFAKKFNSAVFTSSAWVQATLCGPSLITTNSAPGISFAVR
jgi:hypothetical protein